MNGHYEEGKVKETHVNALSFLHAQWYMDLNHGMLVQWQTAHGLELRIPKEIWHTLQAYVYIRSLIYKNEGLKQQHGERS